MWSLTQVIIFLSVSLLSLVHSYRLKCTYVFNGFTYSHSYIKCTIMFPVGGLARTEGDVKWITEDGEGDMVTAPSCTLYHLTGIVVHSGQASGGHYYSYILVR